MIALLLLSFFTFAELNCENLFDWQHDTLKEDYEFTPNGLYRWTKYRFWRKVDNIGRMIIAAGRQGSTWSMPDLVALCEVENDTVMQYLTRRSLLRTARYDYVMTHSDDARGIDVALLYSPFTFRVTNYNCVRVPKLQTRDILYVNGVVRGVDSLHVLVVHAPSRREGEMETRDARRRVARRVAEVIDSIRASSSCSDIIVAGDFNDYAGDKPLLIYEQAGLYDISRTVVGSHCVPATYKYHGQWGSLDHIFTSESMSRRLSDCYICDASFLLTVDEKYGGVRPRRNYVGVKWQDGYSDHLPLVAIFEY